MIDTGSVRALVRAAADEVLSHLTGAAVPDRNCAIGGRPHPAHDGTLLCDGHLQELGRALREIEDETALLSTEPQNAIAYDRTGGSAPAFERTPIRLAAAVLTDPRRGTGITWRPSSPSVDFDELSWDDTPSTLETLHAWARIVRTERNLSVPTATVILGRRTFVMAGPICWHPPLQPCAHRSCATVGRPFQHVVTDTVLAQVTVSGERDLLTRHLGWIAGQPWVDDFYYDIVELLTALRRANSTLDPSAGTCETVKPNGSLCEGKVWHVVIKPDGTVIRGSNPGPADEPGFRCGSCKRVWVGTDALRKRNEMWIEKNERKAESSS